MNRLRRVLAVCVVAFLVLAVALSFSGNLLFKKAQMDGLVTADAIVVLGGEHDGREAYGLELAERGYAGTVLLSDPYPSDDQVMEEACRPTVARITVVCFEPNPSTTRGEAIFTQVMADRYGWDHVIVVTWRYHLPRARYVYHQCFDGKVTMTGVPRAYDFSIVEWEFIYTYQVIGFAKAAIVGCDES